MKPQFNTSNRIEDLVPVGMAVFGIFWYGVQVLVWVIDSLLK